MTSGNNSLNPQRNRKGVPRKALNNTDVRFSSKWMVKAGAFAEMLMAAFSSCVPVPTCMHIRACVCVRPSPTQTWMLESLHLSRGSTLGFYCCLDTYFLPPPLYTYASHTAPVLLCCGNSLSWLLTYSHIYRRGCLC